MTTAVTSHREAADTVRRPAPAHAPHNVPPALSAFVGRQRDLHELGETLERTRILTLTGVGGVGKTRLARELAKAAGARGTYPDGVWWVELAPLAASADVPHAIAAALGVGAGPGVPLEDLVARALCGAADRPRHTLLVLDNCEHVIDAAARLAEHLLRAAPGLTILATSREALGVEGEVSRRVAPLAYPPADPAAGGPATAAWVSTYEAAMLFAERARAAHPGFVFTDRTAPAVAAVCARLDGIPLALELAAAAVPAFGLDGLAARLDDALAVLTRGRRTALPRHRTLRAVLDWSYELLAPEQRRLLQALAAFRGSVPFGAVECVGGAGAHDAGTHDADAHVAGSLDRLVAHSLVEARERDGEMRYRLLEPVRQYAAARLADDPARAAAVRARHARWVRTLAEDAELGLWGPARARTVARLQRNLDDIRAALAWSAGPDGDPLDALRIVGSLTYFWLTAGLLRDGACRIRAAATAAARTGTGEVGRPAHERLALSSTEHTIAVIAWDAGRFDEALAFSARGLARIADLGPESDSGGADATTRRRALILTSRLRAAETHASAMVGDRGRSEASMRAGLAAAVASGDSFTIAGARLAAGLVYLVTGEYHLAESEFADAEQRLRELGDRWLLSLCYERMAELALARRDAGAAAANARTSIALLRPDPDAWFLPRALDTLAAAGALTLAGAADVGTRAAAAGAVACVLGAASALRTRVGAAPSALDRPRHEAALAAAREALGDAFDAAWAAGERMSLAETFALAATAPMLASVAEAPAVGAPAVGAPAVVDAADAVTSGSGASTVDAPGPLPVRLRATVLGPLQVARVAGAREEPVTWATGKARELFLFLAAHPDGATRAQVGRALWPEASDAQLANAFHVSLHHVRRALGGREWVGLAAGRYRLERVLADGAALDCDLDAVRAAAGRLRRARARQEALDDAELAALRAALARRTGPLGDGVPAGDWLVAHQDRVAVDWAAAMIDLGALYVARGTPPAVRAALATYEAVLAHDPLREDAHREVMRCHALLGEPARAVAHYEELAAALRREVGAAPAPNTATLADAIRRGTYAGGPVRA